MKLLASIGVVCALLVTAACDNGKDGTIAGCASALVGDFTGDMEGPATALLSFEGVLAAVVTPEGDDRDFFGDATIDDEGALTPTSQLLVMEGAFDLDTCVGEGSWTLNQMTGAWKLELR